MNIREQFGKYLLLKKLAEDALGETFRAGRVGGHGMEQVVLLRVFNGTGIDAATLSAALQKRKAVHQALVSPNIGNGVDLGEVRGVPFVAYDYVSGKDLAALQEQARRRNHPIPSDHALLIAERIALALAVGYETRLDDDRVLHGCVLPQLVMISNEGETRLLGFEAAPGLRQVVRGAVATKPLARYLSPEARSGAAASKSDDVYSLGAILLELLTSQPVPTDGDLAAFIDNAELSSEGTPLPEDLKRLLKQSLTTADKRLGDVISWHKALSRMMFEGQYNPTTFNLAFFMHNLFRDEIEKESREIEVEKTMELQLPPAAAAAAARCRSRRGAAGRQGAHLRLDELRAARAHRRADRDAGARPREGGQDQAGDRRHRRPAGDRRGRSGTSSCAARPRPPPSPPPPLLPRRPAPTAPPCRQQAAAQLAEAARIEQQYKELLEKQSKDMQARYDEQLASMRKEMDTAKQRAQQAQQAADAPAPPPSRPAPLATVASQPVRPAATQAAAAPAPSTAPAAVPRPPPPPRRHPRSRSRRRRRCPRTSPTPRRPPAPPPRRSCWRGPTPPTRPSPSACAKRRRWWCGCWSTSAAAWNRPSSRASRRASASISLPCRLPRAPASRPPPRVGSRSRGGSTCRSTSSSERGRAAP